MNLIDTGIQKGLIRFDEDKNFITYIHQNKKRNYKNPEEKYRIVAVVSMPQTAFTATGAGVKSSVLFLRKHKTKQTEKISSQKAKLKDKVKEDNEYLTTIEKWEKEKNEAIKKLEQEANKNNPKADKKQISEIIKIKKTCGELAESITVQTM